MSNMETSSANTPAQSDGSIQDVSQQSAGNIGQSSVSTQPPVHQGKIPLNMLYTVSNLNLHKIFEGESHSDYLLQCKLYMLHVTNTDELIYKFMNCKYFYTSFFYVA